ncbi:hypothetical protein Tco_1409057 [Tanacetum coccineum]
MDLNFAADGDLRELSAEEAWETIENFAQGQKEWDKPFKAITEQELASLRAQANELFGNEKVWFEMPREVPSFNEPEPQPNPSPNCPSLDVSLGEERGSEPPIKTHIPDIFRMKVIDPLIIHTPPSPHVASFHPKDVYCYHHPCIDDSKKQYGFKPGLLGQGRSLGVDFLNLEMIKDDWELESKLVSFLGRALSLPIKLKELEKGRIKETHHLEHIIQQTHTLACRSKTLKRPLLVYTLSQDEYVRYRESLSECQLTSSSRREWCEGIRRVPPVFWCQGLGRVIFDERKPRSS